MQVLEHVPLAPLTTLQVGGPARYFAQAATPDDVRQAVDWANLRAVPLFVLGGGSNLVVADSGFPGLVLRIAIGGVERREQDGKQVFEAGAGVEWDALVVQTVAANCAGLECMSGIPGTVGGTPVQNVGAYGQEVSGTIIEVQVLDLRDRQVRSLGHEACGFAYRRSIFNTGERGRFIILRVAYALQPGGAPTIAYRDLKQYFEHNGCPTLVSPGVGETGWGFALKRPTLSDVREAVKEIRLSKAMLIVEGDEDSRSAGSFFKNPALDPADYERLNAAAILLTGSAVPSYPAPARQYKIPAAWLVENAGFHKGYTRGNVGISRKHALAIVNRGGATAAEIIALNHDIQRAVLEKFGIQLTPEPVFVGFE
ncbi:MAG: UDP-N-acetylmuramate dehydrogenase [Acidobacteriia bacterium]|nr:UDP-N-acetylmuramate dehydrogenase [Terriglobia bacterium]